MQSRLAAIVLVGVAILSVSPVLAQQMLEPTGDNASDDEGAQQRAQDELEKVRLGFEKAFAIADAAQRQKAIEDWNTRWLAWQKTYGYLFHYLEETEAGQAANSEVKELLEAVKKAVSIEDPTERLKELERVKVLLTTWLLEHPTKDANMLRLAHRQIVWVLLYGAVNLRIMELNQVSSLPTPTPLFTPTPVPTYWF